MSKERLVIGLQPVRELIRAKQNAVFRVLVEAPTSTQLEAVVRFAEAQQIRVERVARAELDRIAQGGRHQGVAAFAPPLELAILEDLSITPQTLFVALDELEDPQNFGAIIRSAVAFGADAVIWPEHHSAPLSLATFRASAGAIEHATLSVVSSLPSALSKLAADATIVGLDANASQYLAELPLTGPLVLVVGAEGKGLRKPVKNACNALAKLPMPGPIASLNASVAAAIALYEVTRQRAAQTPA